MWKAFKSAVGCADKPAEAAYRCQYCSALFPTYEAADIHEQTSCYQRPGAGQSSGNGQYQPGMGTGGLYRPGGSPGQGQYGPGKQQGPIQIRCGQCQQVFGVPPGAAQCAQRVRCRRPADEPAVCGSRRAGEPSHGPRCPHCRCVNAVPQQGGGSPSAQPSIPTNVYNQSLNWQKANQVGMPGPQPSGRKKALLVGCNYPGTRAELSGCINDVHRMRQMICGMYGFPSSHDCLRVLTDDSGDVRSRPTRANILQGLEWLAQGAQPGDCLFFHFSGHGAQQEDPSYTEEDGYDETICPCDFEYAGMIVDDEIFDRIVAPLPSGVKLTGVMDCCHSGTGLDLPFTWNYGRWQEEDNPCHSAGDVILISGCQDDQTSSDGGGSYGRPAGAMTTALCNTLERSGGLMSHLQLLEGLRSELRSGGFHQVPSLTSSQPFNAQQKYFSPVDYIDGNQNQFLGRHFRKKKHPQNKNLLGGGLGQMLMAGAAGFMIGDLLGGAGGDMLGGMAMGGMDAIGQAADAGGGFLGDLFGSGGPGDLIGGFFGGGGDFFGDD